MANRLLQVFGSYDLFGKSVPGSLLVFGLLSLLPAEILSGGGGGRGLPTLASLAVAVVGVLLVGLVIGQGVHTLADNTEKAFHWLAKRFDRSSRLILAIAAKLRFELPRISQLIEGKPRLEHIFQVSKIVIKQVWDDLLMGPDKKLRWRIPKNALMNVYEWLRSRFWGTYDSLVSHRRLFGKHFEWNYNRPGDGRRWEREERGHLYEQFCREYERRFPEDKSPKQLEPDELMDRYPLIVTAVENGDVTPHASFQSIYSFCRSMWVVSIVIAAVYTEILFGQLVDFRVGCTQFGLPDWIPDVGMLCLSGDVIAVSDGTIGAAVVPDNSVSAVVPVFLISALIFFDAAGTYKRHYVEYLIAGFASLDEETKSGGQDDD